MCMAVHECGYGCMWAFHEDVVLLVDGFHFE